MARERAILCGGLPGGGLPFADSCPIELSRFGPDPNVLLRVEAIREGMSQNVPDVLYDLLDIAAYVYAGDQAAVRGGLAADDLGRSWRRRLFFRVPVRVPEVWADTATTRRLRDVLGFLSEDEYLFDFRPWTGDRPSFQQYIPFDATPFTGEVEEVVMFSGGLDSLAGAVEEVANQSRRVVLLNHRSTSKLVTGHGRLVAELSQRAGPDPPVHIPVWVNKTKLLGREFTQRSRSFLYAALGVTVAHLIGLDRLRFYENGVVSLNLPLSGQVLGARASRTTHPRVLAGFATLFSDLLRKPFVVENPFLWKTKTDVVRLIGDAGFGELIGHATSCAHTWERSTNETHCGNCSQCIDRRFAVLAAGLGDLDPADRYDVDLLVDARESEQSRLMLAAYLETVRRVQWMTDPRDFFGRFGGELSRALSYIPGRRDEAGRRVYDLFRRHAGQVWGVVGQAIRDHTHRLIERDLPPTCLLRQVIDPAPDPAPAAAVEAPLEPDNVFRRCGQAWAVRFGGGESKMLLPTRGAAYIHELIEAAGRPIPATELACRVSLHRERYAIPAGGTRADAEALSTYRANYEDLSDELEEAERNNDSARAERLQHQRAGLAAEIERVTGPGGRLRAETDFREKVRKAVTTAVSRAVRDIRLHHPDLARHLKLHLRCGRDPVYTPSAGTDWQT